MTNIERIQNEGVALLLSSGWAEEKIESIKECLIDFTSQAYYDEMYEDAVVQLCEPDKEPSLEIILTIKYIRAKVSLYEKYYAFWEYFIVDDDGENEAFMGIGANSRFFEEEDGKLSEDEIWADYFYWAIEDRLQSDGV